MNQNAVGGSGFLRVSARTANGALPVPGAQVIIYGAEADQGNAGVLYALRTGEDGLTPPVELDAPPRSLSLQPGTAIPYAQYNIEIRREGYVPVIDLDVPIFDGIVSTQPTLLIPIGADGIIPETQIRESEPESQPSL